VDSKRTILITGSTGGIGKELALKFAKEGYNIIINYRKEPKKAKELKEKIESYGGIAESVKADITKLKEIEYLINETIRLYGRLDILINTVGDYIYKSIEELEYSEWNYLIDSNLNSVYYIIRHTIPYMRKKRWGRIINFGISGIEKLDNNPFRVAYNITKAGVFMLTQAFSQTEGRFGITVNMISPGIVDNDKYSDKYISEISKKIPAGRIGKPADVFGVTKFLISEEANYINGANISVSGGFIIK